MGRGDGLSRLQADRVAALTMRDLLNPEADELPSSVGEQNGLAPDFDVGGDLEGDPADGHVDDPTQDTERGDLADGPSGEAVQSPLDRFGLNREQFVAEQQEVPWIKALVALLLDGALPLDSQLKARVVQMRPRYAIQDGMLVRHVHLPTRSVR
ncbi:hypothetical protein V7S43_012203 [Phytophthora oleae]|uniref:Uncharacterized protein n=1 Tax=Phytophthora oleae TaxID=2107226 RepID=A0ABD3FAS0_9STRA